MEVSFFFVKKQTKIVKDLKRAYAKMTTTFSKNLANEEEQYKKELNMMLSLTGKCNNHIEHLKELAGNMSLNPVERKGLFPNKKISQDKHDNVIQTSVERHY